MVQVLVNFQSRALRMRVTLITLIAIIFVGEIFEVTARRHKRSRSENVQRYAMLVVKVRCTRRHGTH